MPEASHIVSTTSSCEHSIELYKTVEFKAMGLQTYSMPDTDPTLVTLPYPAQTTTTTATISTTNTPTTITRISFADKILITITQNGRLAQWLTVPLAADNPTTTDPHFGLTGTADEDSLLPVTRFQPRTLLGAGGGERETMGQLYASQIASLITTKDPGEGRVLMVGLGIARVDLSREGFLEVLDAVTRVL